MWEALLLILGVTLFLVAVTLAYTSGNEDWPIG